MFGIKLLHDKFRKKERDKAARRKSTKRVPNSEGTSKQATSSQANDDDDPGNMSTAATEAPPKETKAEEHVQKPPEKNAPSTRPRTKMPRSQSSRSAD